MGQALLKWPKKKERVPDATNYPTRKRQQPRKHQKLRNLQQRKKRRLPNQQPRKPQRKLQKKQPSQKPQQKSPLLRKRRSQQQKKQQSLQRRQQRSNAAEQDFISLLFKCYSQNPFSCIHSVDKPL